jgi:hypothetical protein
MRQWGPVITAAGTVEEGVVAVECHHEEWLQDRPIVVKALRNLDCNPLNGTWLHFEHAPGP